MNIIQMKDQVLEEIKRQCGKVDWMPGLGYYFMINNTLCLYMYCRNGSFRFAIPYLTTTTMENKDKIPQFGIRKPKTA